MRRSIKITYSNGHEVFTTINGTNEEIKKYYIGQWFNFGVIGDDMQQAVKVDFLSEVIA